MYTGSPCTNANFCWQDSVYIPFITAWCFIFTNQHADLFFFFSQNIFMHYWKQHQTGDMKIQGTIQRNPEVLPTTRHNIKTMRTPTATEQNSDHWNYEDFIFIVVRNVLMQKKRFDHYRHLLKKRWKDNDKWTLVMPEFSMLMQRQRTSTCHQRGFLIYFALNELTGVGLYPFRFQTESRNFFHVQTESRNTVLGSTTLYWVTCKTTCVTHWASIIMMDV